MDVTVTHQDAELLRQFGLVPGLKELLMLRQVHALEHATVWMLGGTPKRTTHRAITQDADRFGGLSTEQGFYLFGAVETTYLAQAVHKALHRLVTGESHLAIHPRCGTNLAVHLTVSAGLAMGGHMVLPKDPLSQFLGLGAALTLAAQVSPTIGDWLQVNVTTAIPFNLQIQDIQPVAPMQGQPTHFVTVRWREGL
ncbi:MAG: hypothetical protein RLZZ511_2272 [Cyanobacteriota bacterium]|jgi:hypothetical protein